MTASNPSLWTRVGDSFARQRAMALIGARLEHVGPGEVDIAVEHRDDLTQQHGFLHAGVLAALADTACGYAALTLMPEGSAVLSVEFKINMLRPAAGERFVARARVVRPGRTLSTCSADVVALRADEEIQVATMLATMTAVQRDGMQD